MSIHLHIDLDSLLKIGGTLMATLADFTAKLDSIDSKVAAIAAEIADLKGRLDTAGMPTADEDAALARLATLEDALGALVPAPAPPETPTP